MGVRQFRLQFSQSTNVAGWDEVVERAALQNITILPLLYAGPGDGEEPRSGQRFPRKGTSQYSAWLDFVSRVVRRYGTNGEFWRLSHPFTPRPVRAWEVWNEPNRAENDPKLPEGTTQPQPHHYAQFLIDTAATIRTADPSAVILSGGLDSTPSTGAPEPVMAPEEFITRMFDEVSNDGTWGSHTTNQVKAAFDGLSLHPYAFSNAFETRINTMRSRVEVARYALRAVGDTSPLWITELGWAVQGQNLPAGEPVTPAEQARLLTEAITWLKNQSAPELKNIRYVAWYFYRDISDERGIPCGRSICWQNHTGLLDVNGNLRESACRYARLSGGWICGYNTTTFATVTNILHGQPGYVSIAGEVFSTSEGAPAVNGVNVEIRFEREIGNGNYSGVVDDRVQVGVVNGHYQFNFFGKGAGRWRTRTVLPAQAPFNRSESGYHTFQVKRGYRLVNRNSGKCLSVSGNYRVNNQVILQWDCSPNPISWDGQVFTLVPMEPSGQYFELMVNQYNEGGPRCVDVYGANPSDGGQLVLFDCIGAANQQWDLVPISGQPPYEALIARHSGKCMDVPGASIANGVQLIQWSCHWGGNQQWSWQAIE